MAQEPPQRIDLAAELACAVASYRSAWQAVDSELYQLCRSRLSQRNFVDVYAKVVVIGRVYAAGISRSSRALGDREAEVARGLIEVADLIEESLGELTGGEFDRATAVEVVRLHGSVTRSLLSRTGDVWLTSFVSKYLHFHCDIFPIYDSRAAKTIGRFVSWPVVSSVRAAIAEPADWDRAYYNFVAAFLVLQERIDTETSISPTVKETDHLLWRTADSGNSAPPGET